MMLDTPMFNLFFSTMLPLAALFCVWFAVLYLIRGARSLVLRVRMLREGLHACSVIVSHNGQGEERFVPVFSYMTERGDEVDILGNSEFASREEAMMARRPLVYADERPDSAVAKSAFFFVGKPALFILLAVVLTVLAHYLLLYMPD